MTFWLLWVKRRFPLAVFLVCFFKKACFIFVMEICSTAEGHMTWDQFVLSSRFTSFNKRQLCSFYKIKCKSFCSTKGILLLIRISVGQVFFSVRWRFRKSFPSLVLQSCIYGPTRKCVVFTVWRNLYKPTKGLNSLVRLQMGLLFFRVHLINSATVFHVLY